MEMIHKTHGQTNYCENKLALQYMDFNSVESQ